MRKALILALATVFLLGMCTPVFGMGYGWGASSANASTEVVVMLINENFAVSGNAYAVGNSANVTICSYTLASSCVDAGTEAIACGNDGIDVDGVLETGQSSDLVMGTSRVTNDASVEVWAVALSCNSVENSGTAVAVSGDATAIQLCPSNDADVNVDADADATMMDDMYYTYYTYYYRWWW